MKLSKIIGVLVTLALLHGCFEISQSVVIENGQVEYRMDMGVSAQLAAMMAQSEGFSTEKFCESGELVDANIPDGMTATTETRFDADLLVCSITIQGPLDKFEDISANMSQEDHGAYLIDVEMLPDNKLRLVSSFDFEGPDQEEDRDEMAAMLVATTFAGRSLRWEVTAPEIISTNGTTSEDGRTATWEVPLSLAIAEGGQYSFEVVLVHSKPWWQVWQ